jgi:orotate phosphoribosyltransferase
MEQKRAITLLKKTGALLEGHFLLSSGNHSSHYIQCALLFSFPANALIFAQDITDNLPDTNIATVAAPAIGGIIVAYEVARLSDKRAIFLERENNRMTLRRGFSIEKGERVHLVEDVITTGGSVLEIRDVIEKYGGIVTGVSSIIDRSAGRFSIPEPFYSSTVMDLPVYSAGNCPLCARGLPLVKPGSRTDLEK